MIMRTVPTVGCTHRVGHVSLRGHGHSHGGSTALILALRVYGSRLWAAAIGGPCCLPRRGYASRLNSPHEPEVIHAISGERRGPAAPLLPSSPA